MFDSLRQASEGDIILIHGCCPNPSGVDLDEEAWEKLIEILTRRHLLPFIDQRTKGSEMV